VIEKINGINKSGIITKKEVISINQLNYKTPEKSQATEELVDYNASSASSDATTIHGF
jgi:hypothetical protein